MKKIIVGLATVALLGCIGNAKTLKIGLASGAQSMDPYFVNDASTTSILTNIFDTLVTFDKDMKLYANLATSWSNPEPTVWIMNLRKNVQFHNGSKFNADDVIFTFNRMRDWKGSGFKSKLVAFKSIEKVDEYTVKFITKKPYPVFLRKLTYMRILDKETLKDKSNQWIGLNPIGTGAYKLDSWIKGSKITLSVNDKYWQGKGAFNKVIFRPLTNNATRVAAILSGEVDIVNNVPANDVNRIKSSDKLKSIVQPGIRMMFLQMDQDRDNSPYIKTHNGKNPFKDVRVRKALYYGINEDAIIKYVMKDFAAPAAQFAPKTVFGYDPSIKRASFNPVKAKALLVEAGYPNGFEVVLDSPNDRYVNDAQIAQAIASSLAKLDIKVTVNAIPKASFFPKTSKLDTSFFFMGWGSGDADNSSFFDAIVHTNDNKSNGRWNRGRFSNEKVDKLIDLSNSLMNPEERLKVMQEVQRIALVENQIVIPLHYQVDIYAAGKNIDYKPRPDGYITAFEIK